MHANHFDRLTRNCFAAGTRRSLLHVLAGVPVIGLLAARLDLAEEAEAGRRRRQAHRGPHGDKDRNKSRAKSQAKRKKGKAKKGKKKDARPCANAGQTPKKGKRCCQGLVKGGNGRCVSPAPAPNPSRCATTCSGCCVGETCITATTNAACGTGGAPCTPCTLPQTCGGNAPGVCGCTPNTTCPAPLNCGSIDNGCSTGTIACGDCTGSDTCGGGTPSVANVCGCTPTCPSNTCGDQPDGCGGTISCNTCANPKPICTGGNPCAPCVDSGQCGTGHLCLNGSCFTCDVVCNDPGGCTNRVQTAVDGADPGSTIYLCPGIYKGPITIDKSLTLIGAGSGEAVGNTILHGGGSRPVITIDLDQSEPPGITVVLESVRVTGGFDPDEEVPTGQGGGVFILSHQALTTLAMTDCVVSENKAGLGGGIFNSDGDLSLTGCTVLENEVAGKGGGIYTEAGEVTLDDSHVTLNTANQGGGIYNDGGTVTLTGSSVTLNEPDQCFGVDC